MKKSEALMEVERLEKEGKLKEMIPKWEKELETLEKEERKAYDKYCEVAVAKKSKEEINKALVDWEPMRKRKRELESKLSWSRMTPEERERTLQVREELKAEREKEEAAIKKFESKLTKEELELRNEAIMTFLSINDYQGFVCINTAPTPLTPEQKKKLEEERKIEQKEAKEKFEALLKKAGWDPKKIISVLCELDKKGGMITMEEYFLEKYGLYKKNKPLLDDLVWGEPEKKIEKRKYSPPPEACPECKSKKIKKLNTGWLCENCGLCAD